MPAQQYVKALVIMEGKLLLLRNSHFVSNGGLWDLPSGLLLGKESPMQGMARIVKECLGVQATNIINRSSYFDSAMLFNQVYEVVVASTGWNIGRNHSQAKWFDAQGIKTSGEIVNKAKITELFKLYVH